MRQQQAKIPGRPGHRGNLQLGKLIRRRREERGWSREAFANMISVDRSMVVRVEIGDRPVTNPETAEQISQLLAIPYDEIYSIQSIAPPDVLELLHACSGLNISRVRWALGKIANGEMFDEEIKASVKGLGIDKDKVLIPRKRTAAEERAWAKKNA